MRAIFIIMGGLKADGHSVEKRVWRAAKKREEDGDITLVSWNAGVHFATPAVDAAGDAVAILDASRAEPHGYLQTSDAVVAED